MVRYAHDLYYIIPNHVIETSDKSGRGKNIIYQKFLKY